MLVVCGDFNSLPDSAVYRFLQEGRVEPVDEDFLGFPYQPYTQRGATHEQSLRSAFSPVLVNSANGTVHRMAVPNQGGSTNSPSVPATTGGRKWAAGMMASSSSSAGATSDSTAVSIPGYLTNYTPSFKGQIDYIWYKSNCLSPIGGWSAVPMEYLEEVVGLPSAHMPSDHISILVEFRISKPMPTTHSQLHQTQHPANTSAQHHTSASRALTFTHPSSSNSNASASTDQHQVGVKGKSIAIGSNAVGSSAVGRPDTGPK